MNWLDGILFVAVFLAAAIGFWVAWMVRGDAIERARADAEYLKDLWARTGGAQAQTFAINAAARNERVACEDPAVVLGREAAAANLAR